LFVFIFCLFIFFYFSIKQTHQLIIVNSSASDWLAG